MTITQNWLFRLLFVNNKIGYVFWAIQRGEQRQKQDIGLLYQFTKIPAKEFNVLLLIWLI